MKILIERGRGVGDVLMLTPVLRLLKKKHEGCHITVACDEHMMGLLQGNPNVDRVVPLWRLRQHGIIKYLPTRDGLGSETFDTCFNLENLAENAPDTSSMHRIDIFARAAGLDVPLTSEDRRLEMFLTDTDWQKAQTLLASLGLQPSDRLLAMAVRTTCYNRNMPLEKFKRIAELAVAEGWKVAVMDHDRGYGWEGPGILNLAGLTNGPDGHRVAAAIIASADKFFGPDSGLWHVANAVGTPSVVYFGAMNWKLRVTGPTKVLFKNTACYPCDSYHCGWHKKLACVDLDPEVLWEEILEHAEREAVAC